jgi:hypothetical protein
VRHAKAVQLGAILAHQQPACQARASLSRAKRISSGAASLPPAAPAEASAAVETATCAVGAGVPAQAAKANVAASNSAGLGVSQIDGFMGLVP